MSFRNEFDRIIQILGGDRIAGVHLVSIGLISWILFLKFADCYESGKFNSVPIARDYEPVIKPPFRWSDWACPKQDDGSPDLAKQKTGDELIEFQDNELIPYLAEISSDSGSVTNPNSIEYRIDMMNLGAAKRFESGENMREVLDIVDKIDFNSQSQMRELAEWFEEHLNSVLFRSSYYTSQYFTPNALTRTIVQLLKPEIGETVFDAGFGVCNFLMDSFKFLQSANSELTEEQQNLLQNETLYGTDHSPFMYTIGMVRMMLNGVNSPNLYRNNILETDVRKIPEKDQYDIVFAQAGFNRMAEPEHISNFPIQHNKVETLYLQYIMQSLKFNGRAAVVVSDFLLKRALKPLKRLRQELCENFNLHTVLKLPYSFFHGHAYGSTSVIFFDRNSSTSNIWFYECDFEVSSLDDNPYPEEHFQEFMDLYSKRETTKNSWMVPIDQLRVGYNLAPPNPANKRTSKQVSFSISNEQKEDSRQILIQMVDAARDLLGQYLDDWFANIRNRELVEDLMTVEAGIPVPENCLLSEDRSNWPHLQVADLDKHGAIDIASVKYLSQDDSSKYDGTRITESDLYISIAGEIGKTGIVPVELSGATISPDLAKIVINDKNKLNLKYLYLATLTADFQWEVYWAKTVGAEEIPLPEFQEAEIPLPSIEMQQELVNNVWGLYEKINSTKELIKNHDFEEEDKQEEFLKEIQELKQSILGLSTAKIKKLSNPFATGGGGAHFEANAQSFFVALMLADGRAPCLPLGPISAVKLQGRVDGYNTDDIILTIQDSNSSKTHKLLGQIKHSVSITKSCKVLGEVIHAAWSDFSNSAVFDQGRDEIALITQPMSITDRKNLVWLLNHARHSTNSDDFIRDVYKTNFSPPKCADKFEVIKHHLQEANQNAEISNEAVFEFLRHFHLLELDFDSQVGLFQSMLLSMISHFDPASPHATWSRIVDFVQYSNQHAGTITLDTVPEDLKNTFLNPKVQTMPEEFTRPKCAHLIDWSNVENSRILALLILIGSWNSTNEHDNSIISSLLRYENADWMRKVDELHSIPNSPFSLQDGVWTISDKKDLLAKVDLKKINEDNLKDFSKIAVNVLGELDPALELSKNRRPMAQLLNKSRKFSDSIRTGIAEGLAILGNNSELFCNPKSAKKIPKDVLFKLLNGKSWKHWCALNGFLPDLAESAPQEFLDQLSAALTQQPSPIDGMFAQENGGIFGLRFIPKLLSSLEAMAWNEEYLGQSVQILGELAELDPEIATESRAFNSIKNIFLPWLPQTTANFEQRQSEFRDFLDQNPELGWNLLLKLLHNQTTLSHGTYKPHWNNEIQSDHKIEVSKLEYWNQAEYYSNLAIESAGSDAHRIAELVKNMAHLTESALEKLNSKLSSKKIHALPQNDKKLIWESLNKFVLKHKKFPDADWTFSGVQLKTIESIATNLEPTNPFDQYQFLFTNRNTELYEEKNNLKEQQRKLDQKRKIALQEIIKMCGIQDILKFTEIVVSPRTVGEVLAMINDKQIAETLLPDTLTTNELKQKEFVRAFVNKRCKLKGWKWVDKTLNFEWTLVQKARFLSYLPFEKDTWTRVADWLQSEESEYWKTVQVKVNNYEDLETAIEKLIQYDRPKTAANCLYQLLSNKRAINCDLCIRALKAAVTSKETDTNFLDHDIVSLIEYLQSAPDADKSQVAKVEWIYLQMIFELNSRPLELERKLSTDADYFCDLIQICYLPKGSDRSLREFSDAQKANATYALDLLQNWTIPPGTESDGQFNPKLFESWLQSVKDTCIETGHLEMAMVHLGNVLAFVPEDNNGNLIDETIAKVLDDRDLQDMRKGFYTGRINAEDYEIEDTAGTAEKKLSKKYRNKAKLIKKKGFDRLATTFRDIAIFYETQAERPKYERARKIMQI